MSIHIKTLITCKQYEDDQYIKTVLYFGKYLLKSTFFRLESRTSLCIYDIIY